MTVHHVGYLVDNIHAAKSEFQQLGFHCVGEIVEDLSREVYILFLSNALQTVELIQPTSQSSPIYKLRKKYRNSPYHICYETDDLQSALNRMVNSEDFGVLIQAPLPAPAIPGSPNVAFIMSRNIGMIELVEKVSEDEVNAGTNPKNCPK